MTSQKRLHTAGTRRPAAGWKNSALGGMVALAAAGWILESWYQPGAFAEGRAPVQQLSEKEVRERHSRVQSDLRSMHTAIESYRVDYGVYPLALHCITSPVCYLTDIFADPFTPAGFGKMESADRLVHTETTNERIEVRMYSIGPDQVDDGANTFYDPTNGILSGGDIIRVAEYEVIDTFEDHNDQQKAFETRDSLVRARDGLQYWFSSHQSMPATLQELVDARMLPIVPRDCYRTDGSQISYTVDNQTGIAMVYSFGPDGDDDGGIKKIRGVVARDATPDGDIGITVDINEWRTAMPESAPPPVEQADPMMAALLKVVEQDGRPNSLVNYQKAAKLLSPNYSSAGEKAGEVLKSGWKDDEELVAWFAYFRPSIDEARAGAQLRSAYGIGYEMGASAPVPDFLAAQVTSKVMLAEALYKDSKNLSGDGVREALDVMQMGHDYCTPGNTLISHLIGIAIESMASKAIEHLVAGSRLEPADLQLVVTELARLDSTQGSLDLALEAERELMRVTFEQGRDEFVESVEMFREVEVENKTKVEVCEENLFKMQGALQQYMIEEKIATREEALKRLGSVHATDLEGGPMIGPSSYIRSKLICPHGGTYHYIADSNIPFFAVCTHIDGPLPHHPRLVSGARATLEMARAEVERMGLQSTGSDTSPSDNNFEVEASKINAMLAEWGVTAENVDTLFADALVDLEEFYVAELAFVRKPSWDKDWTAHVAETEASAEKMNPLVRRSIPNFGEADTRFNVMVARRRMAALRAAIELHRSQHGQIPQALDGFEVPIDPFTGQPFRYIPSNEQLSYTLYSFGPDRVDDGTAEAYDPTNGTFSAGDIFTE